MLLQTAVTVIDYGFSDDRIAIKKALIKYTIRALNHLTLYCHCIFKEQAQLSSGWQISCASGFMSG